MGTRSSASTAPTSAPHDVLRSAHGAIETDCPSAGRPNSSGRVGQSPARRGDSGSRTERIGRRESSSRASRRPTLVFSGAHLCGCSSEAEHQLPKLRTRVRFPSPAPTNSLVDGHFSLAPRETVTALMPITCLRNWTLTRSFALRIGGIRPQIRIRAYGGLAPRSRYSAG